jgi:hypothetical protein
MFYRKQITIIILLFMSANMSSHAVDYDPERLEGVLEVISQTTGVSPQLNEIEYFYENPISLPSSTIFDIAQLPGITSSHALRIKELIKRDSSDLNYPTIIEDLRLNDEQAYILEICTTLDEDIPFDPRGYARLRSNNKLLETKGFEKGVFQGDKLDLYQRYTFSSQQYKAGLLMDKEAGERQFVDFLSAYASGVFGKTKIILGDYYVEKGMGNILWKSYGLRKGATSVSPTVQYGTGIKEYRSSIDYLFFRGAAIESQLDISDVSFNISAWAAHSPRSARIDDEGNATSIYATGLYRTPTEIEKKNTLNEENLGFSLESTYKNFKIGGTAFYLDFDHEIISQSVSSFNGKNGFLGTAYGYYIEDLYSIGGELSRDAKGNLGAKSGFQLDFDWLEIGLAYRRFDENFRSPYGYNFGETQSPANEEGYYLGAGIFLSDNFQINCYTDIYHSMGRTYYVPERTHGVDMFSEFIYNFDYANRIKFRVQNESKTDRRKLESEEYAIYDRRRLNLRLDYYGRIFVGLDYRLRLDAVEINFENYFKKEYGLVGFAELKYQLIDQMGIGGRFSRFSTQSYESAIWQYEAIFQGYTLTQPLYMNGYRFYLFIKYQPIKNINLRIRYINTHKFDATEMGSGYDQIQGDTDPRLYMQIDVKI